VDAVAPEEVEPLPDGAELWLVPVDVLDPLGWLWVLCLEDSPVFEASPVLEASPVFEDSPVFDEVVVAGSF
jgi:hypothetical protein